MLGRYNKKDKVLAFLIVLALTEVAKLQMIKKRKAQLVDLKSAMLGEGLLLNQCLVKHRNKDKRLLQHQ